MSILNDPSSKYISAQSTSEVAISWHHLGWSAPKHAAKQNLKPVYIYIYICSRFISFIK